MRPRWGRGRHLVSRQKINVDGDIPSGTALEERACEIARDRLSGLLPPEALEEALTGLAPEEITGPGGLITQLAGRVVEAALGAELSEHLGYPPGRGASGRGGQRPQRVDAEDAQDRARGGGGPHPARSSGQLRAAAGRQAPDPPGGTG